MAMLQGAASCGSMGCSIRQLCLPKLPAAQEEQWAPNAGAQAQCAAAPSTHTHTYTIHTYGVLICAGHMHVHACAPFTNIANACKKAARKATALVKPGPAGCSCRACKRARAQGRGRRDSYRRATDCSSLTVAAWLPPLSWQQVRPPSVAPAPGN